MGIRIQNLIGTRSFYKRVFMLAIPVMIQGFITQFVSLIDNIMVGQLGALPIAAVSISNTIFFIMNLAVFGSISGAEIFGAQFYGKREYQQQAHAFWMKMYFALFIGLTVIFLLFVAYRPIISLWLHDTPENMAITLDLCKQYMFVMFLGIPFYCVSQSIVSTLKESGKTIVCMESALLALMVNLCLDYVLIFGKFGLPAFGVRGAAGATAIARVIECLFVISWVLRKKEQLPMFKDVLKYKRVEKKLRNQILFKAMPLMCNEILYSGSMAFFSSCYSTRGLDVVSAIAIVDVVVQLFRTFFISLGSAISILVGQALGKGEIERAIREDAQLITLSFLISLGTMLVTIGCAHGFTLLYNVSDDVRELAFWLIFIAALYEPVSALVNSAYFTIRSGGKAVTTFFLDGGLSVLVGVPLSWAVAYLTDWNIFFVYAISQSYNLIKLIPQYVVVFKKSWAQSLVRPE